MTATIVLGVSERPEAEAARLRTRILAAAGAPATPPSPRARPLPLRLPRHRSWRPRLSPRTVAAAVLAIAVAGLSGWNVHLTRELQVARAAVTSHALASRSSSLSSASGRVVTLRDQRAVLVEFRHMPQPEPGTVYELWLGTGAGSMVPAGVFRPDADGSKLVLLDQDASRYSVIALTVERGPDGAPAPTQAPGMSGPV